MLTNLFDGLAYGMLLFVLACGLSVTLGVMNFINLAHGAFAMAGGYLAVALVNTLGVPFLACLPLVFVATALLGLLLERTLYVHVYARSHLDQVLFSIGLVFMAMAAIDYTRGSRQVFVRIPEWLNARFEVLGASIGAYRLMIVLLCGAIALALQLVLSRTRFGSRLRAAVDDPVVARGLGINVGAVFALTFALTINASLLVLAAAVFYPHHEVVTDIGQASHLLTPLLGSTLAPILFGIALIACGLNSTVTATMAGQIVMEGFIRFRMAAWARRLITRGIAIIPALIAVYVFGAAQAGRLLVFSQVILSFQLPFAVVPLVLFTASRQKLGDLVSPRWLTAIAAVVATLIIGLNAKLLFDFATGGLG